MKVATAGPVGGGAYGSGPGAGGGESGGGMARCVCGSNGQVPLRSQPARRILIWDNVSRCRRRTTRAHRRAPAEQYESPVRANSQQVLTSGPSPAASHLLGSWRRRRRPRSTPRRSPRRRTSRAALRAVRCCSLLEACTGCRGQGEVPAARCKTLAAPLLGCRGPGTVCRRGRQRACIPSTRGLNLSAGVPRPLSSRARSARCTQDVEAASRTVISDES